MLPWESVPVANDVYERLLLFNVVVVVFCLFVCLFCFSSSSAAIWHSICTSCPSPSIDWTEPTCLEYQGSQSFFGSGCMHYGQYFVCEIGKEGTLKFIRDV